jgi:hypothetical protein
VFYTNYRMAVYSSFSLFVQSFLSHFNSFLPPLPPFIPTHTDGVPFK